MNTGDPSVVSRRESTARSYCRWFTPVLQRAKGSLLWGDDERRYIDFLAGAGSLNYGHNDEDLQAALVDYIAGDGIAHGLDMTTGAKVEFLRAFERHILTPRGLDYRCQFTGPTGANAVEAAIKLARKVTGRHQIIAFTRAFHGVSSGALAATANSYFRGGAEQGLSGVTRMPYDGYFGPHVDTSELLAALLADPASGVEPPAAILLETVQGEGGLEVASPDWLRAVARIAHDVGALLIVDDIQAGCGRTGTFFSVEPAGIQPDLVALSKSLSGFGLPMSLLCIAPQWDQWRPGEHNGTFRGNAHAFVTARAALEKFWAGEEFESLVARRADLLEHRLSAMTTLVEGSRVKGRGMMQGLDVGCGDLAADIRGRCVEAGLLIETCGPQDEVLKVLAPLTTPDQLLHEGLDIMEHATADAAGRAAEPVGTSVGSPTALAG